MLHVILKKFKINKNATERADKMYSAYGQSMLTSRQIWIWFSKSRSRDM